MTACLMHCQGWRLSSVPGSGDEKHQCDLDLGPGASRYPSENSKMFDDVSLSSHRDCSVDAGCATGAYSSFRSSCGEPGSSGLGKGPVVPIYREKRRVISIEGCHDAGVWSELSCELVRLEFV